MGVVGTRQALKRRKNGMTEKPILTGDTGIIVMAKGMAVKVSLDPILLCALIEQESAWNRYAIRYEPAFMRKYVAPLYTAGKISATEAYARCFSWGLGQNMGQVAREIGYTGPLAQICEPAIGIDLTCKILLAKLKISDGDIVKGLQHYNGGADPLYAAKVLARMVHYGGVAPNGTSDIAK